MVVVLILASTAAVLTTVALTPLFRHLAIRGGAVDQPGPRRVHASATPYLGGLGIFGGFTAGAAVLILFGSLPADDRIKVLGIGLGGLLVLAVGVADDLGSFWSARLPWLADRDGRGMRPLAKLLGQVGAALILCAFGVRIVGTHMPLSPDPYLYLPFGALSWPLTVAWVVAITNAVNLIDGLDGLAAGVSTISAATLLAVAILDPPMWVAALLAGPLLGACLGFLPFNFHPARIFMGDAGALFLGFALSAVSVIGPMKGPTVITLAVPALAMGLPVFDTIMAIVRRWGSGGQVGVGDQAHLHHRLLALGLSHREAVLVLYAVSGWLGVSALAVDSLKPDMALTILVFVLASAALVARLIGMAGRRAKSSSRSGLGL